MSKYSIYIMTKGLILKELVGLPTDISRMQGCAQDDPSGGYNITKVAEWWLWLATAD